MQQLSDLKANIRTAEENETTLYRTDNLYDAHDDIVLHTYFPDNNTCHHVSPNYHYLGQQYSDSDIKKLLDIELILDINKFRDPFYYVEDKGLQGILIELSKYVFGSIRCLPQFIWYLQQNVPLLQFRINILKSIVENPACFYFKFSRVAFEASQRYISNRVENIRPLAHEYIALELLCRLDTAEGNAFLKCCREGDFSNFNRRSFQNSNYVCIKHLAILTLGTEIAAAYGHESLLPELLALVPHTDPKLAEEYRQDMLRAAALSAIKYGQLNFLKVLTTYNFTLGHPHVQEAIKSNQVEILQYLLSQGLNILENTYEQYQSQSAGESSTMTYFLNLAASHGHYRMLAWLIDYINTSDIPSMQSVDICVAFDEAIKHLDVKAIELLCKLNVNKSKNDFVYMLQLRYSLAPYNPALSELDAANIDCFSLKIYSEHEANKAKRIYSLIADKILDVREQYVGGQSLLIGWEQSVQNQINQSLEAYACLKDSLTIQDESADKQVGSSYTRF